MADESASQEWEEFVEGTVALEDVDQEDGGETGSSFEALAGRIARSGRPDFRFSLLTGVGLLLVAAALAALLPSANVAEGSFWRVGRDLVEQLLVVGNSLAIPLGLAALIFLAVALAVAVSGSDLGRPVVVAQPFIGGAGVLCTGAIWAGFLALALVNLAILLLIIIAYIVAAIIVLAMFFGVLIGMLNQ